MDYALFDLKPRGSAYSTTYTPHRRSNHIYFEIIICIIYPSYLLGFLIFFLSGYYERFASTNAHNGERRNRGCELASPFAERSVAHTVFYPNFRKARLLAAGSRCCRILGSRADDKLTVSGFRLSLAFQVSVVRKQ